MTGYCQKDKIMVEVDQVQTVRLPNLRYIHKGVCKKCGTVVFVKVEDRDIIIDRNGRKCPRSVFVGKGTPAMIQKVSFGQSLFVGGKEIKKEVAVALPSVEDIKKKIKGALDGSKIQL